MVTALRQPPHGAVRRRFWLAMVGGAVALLLVPFSARVEGRLETAVHIRAGEAEAVDRELGERLQSPYVHSVILVLKGLPNADSPAAKQALSFVADNLRSEPGVSGVLSSLDWSNPLFLGKGGGTLMIVGLQPKAGSVESLIPRLRERDTWMQNQLRAQFPDAKLELTGETPLNFDLRKISSADVNHAEARVLPVTLVLLLLAFGSLVAAMLPLCVGVLAISMTMGACALLAHYLHLSILVQNLATMLGLGLGIDYALLMVSRFREALADGHEPGAAADIAARQAGRTLIISASTVAIGFAALLWVPISELRSIGVAGLLVATMSVLLCTLILPFVLGHLGSRIDRANLLSLKTWGGKKTGVVLPVGERWRRWGMAVTARPWTALFLAGTPLLLLAWQARRIAPGLPGIDWLPASAESVQALHSLQEMGRAGIVQSLRIVLELPPATPAASDAGWNAVTRLTRFLAADSRTEQVISLPTLTGMAESSSMIDLIPQSTRNTLLSSDGQVTLLEVLPAAAVTPSQQSNWVRQLRHADIASITGVPGTVIRIGGLPALDADYDQVVRERLPWVLGAVVGGSLLALILGLRSLFAACKAVALNLLSVGAAFGALVLVFQEGHGSWLFAVSRATGNVFTIIPILSFAIVFGLSMDYEVFLVTRILEERQRGLPERAAVVEGLASTAGLITSAAAIMITVFVGFTLGNFLVLKMLGFTLAFAVLVDATIVRMVIGPALLQLAGDWNWWPYGLTGSPTGSPTGSLIATETGRAR
jgi:RND superfamily putative drug exporter